jgi:septal ring factor EnvC (AmiA/AmiB activator)
MQQAPGGRGEAPPPLPPPTETIDKSPQVNSLKTQIEGVDAELKATETEEADLVKQINDRKGVRLSYNSLQMRQLESDLAPLRQQLSDVQMKKGALLQKKADMEAQLRALQ